MRKTLSKQDTAPGKWLRYFYHTKSGALLLKLMTQRWVSQTAGAFLDTKLSCKLIEGYIKRNGIDMSQFEEEDYASFNAFFTRHVRPELRPVDYDKNAFIAPCDGKVSVYPITADNTLEIKGFTYTVDSLLKNPTASKRYEGGLCIVFRLAVDDYHRYIYVDDCISGREHFIKGKLHTVQNVALEARRVFSENCRAWTVLHTENFGPVTQVEVGAMMVGRISNNHKDKAVTVTRGTEKGRFEFGGSTIVLLVQKDRVALDEEFLTNTQNELETIVRCGERIGTKIEA